MTPMQRAAVVAEALTWLDTPYHNHARIKGVGVDCAQVLCAVYENVGLVPHVETGYYAPDWHLHRSEELYIGWLDQYCVRLPRSVAPLPGDIALFKYGRCYSHGAIVVEDNLLVHSYLGRGVILTRMHEEPLAGRDVMHWTLR
jgi:cell wall-associated NlpC family hydrolase